MRQLVMYSDQVIAEKRQVDEYLIRLLAKHSGRVGYVASSSDPSRQYFMQKQRYYQQLSLDLATYIGPDTKFDTALLNDFFSCDAIHLSGGNTYYYFLYWLRQSGLLARLQHYAENIGVLVGASAGAILMTPQINSAKFCGDRHYPLLTGFEGLGLVDFLFVPHFVDTTEKTLIQFFATRQNRTIYGCHNGDGIVVTGDQIKLLGRVVTIAPQTE